MKAGRKLDVIVAEKVKGCKIIPGCYKWEHDNGGHVERHSIPHYSTNLSDAWSVREWLVENIGGVRLERLCDDDNPEYCEIWNGEEYFRVKAKTAPLAICLAALKAYGVDID